MERPRGSRKDLKTFKDVARKIKKNIDGKGGYLDLPSEPTLRRNDRLGHRNNGTGSYTTQRAGRDSGARGSFSPNIKICKNNE